MMIIIYLSSFPGRENHGDKLIISDVPQKLFLKKSQKALEQLYKHVLEISQLGPRTRMIMNYQMAISINSSL